MNLLKNLIIKKEDSNLEQLLISDFRKHQYEKVLPYFIKLMIEYISSQNKNYLTINDLTIVPQKEYIGINDSHYTLITIKIMQNTDIRTFFKVLIPTLIDDCFFVLNGNYFIPTLYMVDKPIVFKKKSLKFTSLFNSISMYEKIITFIQGNIPISYFIDLFITDPEERQNFMDAMEIQQKVAPEEEIINFFHKMFGCETKKESIIEFIERLFFDDYTKYLYQCCYNLEEKELTINNILKLAVKLKQNNDQDIFIDLRYKRLIFMEVLLSPLLKRIGVAASQAARGFPVSFLHINQMELVKYFNTKLSNRFIYDCANAFSGMLLHKVNMLNPGSTNAPSIIANLHETHYKKICPISISNQKPGETIFIVPNTMIDSIGQFVDETGVIRKC